MSGGYEGLSREDDTCDSHIPPLGLGEGEHECFLAQPTSPCNPAFVSRMTRALMDSLGPEWRLKLPSIPLVPVSAQKRWDSEYHNETPKGKSKETTTAKSRGKL